MDVSSLSGGWEANKRLYAYSLERAQGNSDCFARPFACLSEASENASSICCPFI